MKKLIYSSFLSIATVFAIGYTGLNVAECEPLTLVNNEDCESHNFKVTK